MGERGYCCLSFCICFLNPLRRIRATPLARRAPFVYFIDISPVCGGIYSQRARLFNQPQDRISSHLSVHIIKTHGFAYHQPQGCISSSQRLAYHQGVNLAYFVMLSVVETSKKTFYNKSHPSTFTSANFTALAISLQAGDSSTSFHSAQNDK